MSSDIRKEAVEAMVKVFFKNTAEEVYPTLKSDEYGFLRLDLKLDFHKLVDYDPSMMTTMINKYFAIHKLVEDIVCKQIQKRFSISSYAEVQKKLKVRMILDNFPKMKLNLESGSIIQMLTKRDTGFLVRLSGLTIAETLKEGSFSKKKFYKSNCSCIDRMVKCVGSSLHQSIKQKDDLSVKTYTYVPKCKICKTEFDLLQNKEIFTRFKEVRVREQDKRLDFVLFLEDEQTVMGVGDTLDGLFYLDWICKLKSYGDRLTGDVIRVLFAINIEKQVVQDVSGNQEESQIVKLRSLKCFRSINPKLQDDAYVTNTIDIWSDNMAKMLQYLNRDNLLPAIVDLSFLLLIVWHLFNDGSQVSNSLLTLVSSDEDQPTSKEILDGQISGSKLNILFFYRDTKLIEHQLTKLCKGTVNLDFFPSEVDEASCKEWLLMNSKSLVVLSNFHLLPKRVKDILSRTIETRSILLPGEQPIPLQCSFVILVDSLEVLSSRKSNELKSWTFVDSIDLCFDLNNPADRYKHSDQFTATTEAISNLYCTGNLNAGKVHELKGLRSQHSSSDPSSQNSRITYLCNKLCQKLVNKPENESKPEEVQKLADPTAKNFLIGYVSALKDEGRMSMLNMMALKKLTLGCRLLRSVVFDDASTLSQSVRDISSGIFSAEQFDSLLACLLFEASRLTISPLFKEQFKGLAPSVISSINYCCLNFINQFSKNQNQENGGKICHQPLHIILEEARSMMFNISNYYL